MTDSIRQESRADKKTRKEMIEWLVVQKKMQGLTNREISEQIGIEEKMVALALRRGLKNAKAETRETSKFIVDIELLRLDQLYSFAWAKAKRGEPDGIRDCLKIMERRAKFLGMDAAVKFQVAEGPALDLEKMSEADLIAMEELLNRNSVSGDEDEGDEGDTDYGDSSSA